MVVLCQLKELELSCFGCCGNSYSNKRKILRDMRKNNSEFDKKKSLKVFMSRANELRPSGICANLIFKKKTFYCPGHPALHGGRDYRNLDPDCDKDHVCMTYGLFQNWSAEKQQAFLDFLKSKKFDSFTYSVRMDDNSILKEFEKK